MFFVTVIRIGDILEKIQILGPYLWLMYQDADPAIFVRDLQDANKNFYFIYKILCLFLFEGTFNDYSFKIKSHKKSYNSRNQGFS